MPASGGGPGLFLTDPQTLLASLDHAHTAIPRASVSLCVNVGEDRAPITGPLGGPEELACGKDSAVTGSHREGAI